MVCLPHLCVSQLLHNFPVDFVDSNGVKFWSGPKRPPTALAFNPEDPTHLSFVVSAAHILANAFGVAVPSGVFSVVVQMCCVQDASLRVRRFPLLRKGEPCVIGACVRAYVCLDRVYHPGGMPAHPRCH